MIYLQIQHYPHEVAKMRIKIVKKVLLIVGLTLFGLIMTFAIYSSFYYHSNTTVSDIAEVTVDVSQDNIYLIPDTTYTKMIVFYPGAKVDPEAYLPLMAELANRGVLGVIVKMPYNFAFFGVNRASSIISQYSGLDCFIMGHSLGGAMAASFAAANPDSVAGLILLASYSTKEVSVPALSIYGDMDGILNMQNYVANLTNLTSPQEYVIEGGNHSQFGDYGLQRKDGTASISRDEQIAETVDQIITFIGD